MNFDIDQIDQKFWEIYAFLPAALELTWDSNTRV